MSDDLTKLVPLLKEIQQRSHRGRGRPLPLSDVRAAIEAFRANIGERALDPDPVTRCIRCEDVGFTFVHEKGARRARACVCRLEPATMPRTVFDLPGEFKDARLANYTQRFENAHAINAARQWINGERSHLYLFGDTGRGKSRLAASLLNEAAEHGIPGAFIRVPWLILLQLRAIDDARWRADANDLMERALKTTNVVLDDMAGGEKGSDHSRGLLVTVLDRRFDRQLRTIITSNLSLQQLSEFYSDNRISSRIAGACGETIELGGIDGRLEPRPSARANVRRRDMRLVDQ
jgi:DNA replication protein DnaC